MPSKPKTSAELDFLTSLEQGEVVTQMHLSKRVSVSVGLINALLKRAMHKGYVKAKSAPYKRYAYYLTPRGFAEKSRLVAEYLETSLDFFRVARQDYSDVLARGRASGVARVAFIGSGELAEIAFLAAREVGVDVVWIFDRETNGDAFHGIPVARSLEGLSSVDAVLITDARGPQRAFDFACDCFDDSRILAPSFLRITRAPPRLRARVAVS